MLNSVSSESKSTQISGSSPSWACRDESEKGRLRDVGMRAAAKWRLENGLMSRRRRCEWRAPLFTGRRAETHPSPNSGGEVGVSACLDASHASGSVALAGEFALRGDVGELGIPGGEIGVAVRGVAADDT